MTTPSISPRARDALPKELSWIPDLVNGVFFAPCDVHSTGSKGEQRNIFSIASRRSLCPACAAGASASNTIQIRRSSYHNVVRVQDVCRLMNVTQIQTYIINSARVVFLNERPHPRSAKAKEAKGAGSERGDQHARSGSTSQATVSSECGYCARILQSDNNRYCSISCKVNGGEDMTPTDEIDFAFAEETIKPTPRKSTQAKNATSAEKVNSDRRSPARNKSPVSESSRKRSKSPVAVKMEEDSPPLSAPPTPTKSSMKRKAMFKDEKRTQYESLMTTAEQDEAVDDMAREIDDSVQSRARAAPHVSSSGSARESEAYESVPLRGAGRTLAQRAQSHLKALRKTLRNTFSDSLSGSSPGGSRTTYSNRAYEDSSFVGSPPSGQLLTRHHARNRSIDLRHVLDTLEETLDGASTAAMLLQELRDSGGDPEADVAVNDALDLELSDVCEAHRSHLMQVAQMSDRFVSLSEDQLGRLLSTVESLNAAVLSIRRTSSAAVREASAPVSIPTGRPSLGSSRIECATTEAEEEAMIAEAISASLKLQADAQNADVASERQPQSSASDGVNATAPSSTRKQTTEELLANLIDI